MCIFLSLEEFIQSLNKMIIVYMIGVNINKYNNFNFINKRKINFKIHVVYDVRQNERNDGTKRNEIGLKETKRNDMDKRK